MAVSLVTGTRLARTVFDPSFGAHSLTLGTSLTSPRLSFPMGAVGQESRSSGFWAMAADNLCLLPICQESLAPQTLHPQRPVLPSPGFNFSPRSEGKMECSPLKTEALGYLELHLGRLGESHQTYHAGGAHIYQGSRFLPGHLAKDRGAGMGCSRQ